MNTFTKTIRILLIGISSFFILIIPALNIQWFTSGLGVIEFPEKQIIILCLFAFVLMKAQFTQRGELIATWVAMAIALFTFITKGVILFFSADGAIAEWHGICFGIGSSLLILSVLNLEKLKTHRRIQQSGAGYPPQGVGSPDP